MNKQEYLTYLTNAEAKAMNCANLRGVAALWKENTACISFYFNGEISEKDLELRSDACGEIIANFPDALLEENYIRLDSPQPLPKENFLAYIKAI
jgi:hypothetical protein